MLVVDTIVDRLAYITNASKRYTWHRAPLREEDMEAVQEASQPSEFDPLRLRATMFQNDPYVFVRELRYGSSNQYILARVIVLSERGRRPIVPWDLYRDIFTAFGRCANKPFWKVILFCATHPRLFPAVGVQPTEAHVNGGYAYPNNPQSVVIYREEESERVLLHELLHACGSDNFQHEEWYRESLTETWAELFLIGVLAKGSQRKGRALWLRQSQWIVDQANQLRINNGVRTPSHYAYRYINGRIDVLKGLGLELPPPSNRLLTSLRFTSPDLQN